MIHGAHGIFLVATLEILEEIFNKEWQGPEMLWIHGAHGGHGFFFIHGGQDFLVATLEIFGGNLCLDVADARNQSSELIYGAHGEHRIILQVKAS